MLHYLLHGSNLHFLLLLYPLLYVKYVSCVWRNFLTGKILTNDKYDEENFERQHLRPPVLAILLETIKILMDC